MTEPRNAPLEPSNCLDSPADVRPVSRIAWVTLGLGIATIVASVAYAFTELKLFLAVTVVTCVMSVLIGIAAFARVLFSITKRRGLVHAFFGIVLSLWPSLLIVPATASVREAAARKTSQNNMKQIVLAFHNYESAHGHLPPAAIRDNAGKPLLSWRVAIIPYLESSPLYREFHLDEPWDSPHNLALLPQMPVFYRSPGNKAPGPHMTFYRVFVGQRTGFDNEECKIANMIDGSSETIAVIEAGEAVPWTKPDELDYHPEKPLPPLGGVFRVNDRWDRLTGKYESMHAAFFDGSVRIFPLNFPESKLRPMITRNGGEKVDFVNE